MPPTDPSDTLDSARAVMARCGQLATYSEEPDRLTRRYATPPMRQANAAVAGWMRAAGMATRQDAAGNLIGRYEAESPNAPALLLGSHLDTVRDAGKYDGPLGVLVALACVEYLHVQERRLPFAIEVLAFADEEGLRYHTAYLGSSAVAGTFDPAWLALTDAEGVPLAEAIRAFGGDPDTISNARWSGGHLLGYCEVHIEQGPILEREDLPVGLVTGIQGQSRLTLTFTGEAGHAGTVPMSLRRDALSAAAEFALAVERYARETSNLVATIGQLAVEPGASNVIPGRVTLSLDLRHPDDTTRERALTDLRARATTITQARGLAVTHHIAQENGAVPCSPHLRALLAEAIAAAGYPVRELASGAGHDAVMMAYLTEIAMLFVPCAGGISHAPAEAVTTEDVAAAIAVLYRFIASLAEKESHA
jgi:allantoate deiminase